jgi:hypothetical protein
MEVKHPAILVDSGHMIVPGMDKNNRYGSCQNKKRQLTSDKKMKLSKGSRSISFIFLSGSSFFSS